MKILVVTNLYPPHHIGGYELGCRDVVERLRARGHQVRVLTGNFVLPGVALPPEEEVERVLQIDFGEGYPRHNKREECRKFAEAAKRFAPDVIYFWNQAGLCLWLPFTARRKGHRMAFFLSDTNFASWRIGAWLARVAQRNSLVRALFGKTFLVRGWPIIRNRTCHFASGFLKRVAEKSDARFAEKTSIVAHWGIDPSQFVSARAESPWPPRRFLYVGQMIPQKGVHTALAAFALLTQERGFESAVFSLAGGGMNPAYEKDLRDLAEQLGIASQVRFLGKVPRAELPRVYAENDILIFPSEWEEPFAITPLEAMSCGLAVVGTTTGGSGELFRDRETAMTFQAGNAVDCARALRDLAGDRDLGEKIRDNAKREVLENHVLDAMVDAIEKNLQDLRS